MFIFLVLIAPAVCEWVEISQHHIRKPPRTHNFRLTEKVTEEFLEDVTRASVYPNQSLADHSWSKANINMVPKIGNVQRVQLDDSPIKAPSLNANPVRNIFKVGIETATKIDDRDSVHSGFSETKQHKISGGVRDDVRHKTTVKFGTPNVEKVHPQIAFTTKDTFQDTTNINERNKPDSNRNQRPSDEVERVNFNKPGGTRNPDTNDVNNSFKMSTNRPKSNISVRPLIFGQDFVKTNKNTYFITEAETTNKGRNDFGKLPPSKVDVNPGSTSPTLKRNKHPLKEHPDITKNNPNGEDAIGVNQGTIIRTKLTNPEFVTKIDKLTDDNSDTTVTDDNENPNINNNPFKSKNENPSDENFGQEEELDASNKVNSLENLMNFMKVVADTIRRNTRRSVSSKTRYLTNLKNTIITNIAERIDATWPDDEPSNTRATRAAHATERGHLEIPSSESALMTISFLTFAVFLIKLVLQVIQTYKNKAMMVSPAVVAVGRAAAKRSSKP